jgi:predicted membrane-bound spermidine synthase/Tfp pilus assembly protein PilF
MNSKTPYKLLAILYFCSGISALVYEIIWARMLGLAVGTAVTAWASVLVSYMGGMALGSLLGGRFADRVSRPLLLFAVCELGIGVTGFASPSLLYGIQHLSGSMPQFPGLQIAISIMVLIIPTMLMGATFPLISRVIIEGKRSAGHDIAVIYSSNVLGAITGTVLAGFFLMPLLGMSVSIRGAAILNVIVALLALVLLKTNQLRTRNLESESEMGSVSIDKDQPLWLFPLILFCSGFCIMAFEVLWSRILVFFLTSTTYSFTVTLSVVLGGLALGGMTATVIVKSKCSINWVAAMQVFIGLYGFSTHFFLPALDSIIHLNETAVNNVWWHWVGVRYVACFALIFPPAFCIGATYPLAMGESCRLFKSVGRSIGLLSSLNTLGGIAGSLAAAFILVPVLGMQRSIMVIALINCLAGWSVLGWSKNGRKKWAVPGMIVSLIAGSLLLGYFKVHPMIVHRQTIGNNKNIRVISYKEDQVASVAVLESPKDRKINIDGFNAAGTYHYEYMHLLAHLPALLCASPDTTLVICFGTGTTCGTMAQYPQIKSIDCVEISPAVVDAAKYFTDVNYSVTENPKVHILIGDGRNHLLRTKRLYNCITLEPMLPYMASATNLYSADFYQICRSRLNNHGVMAQWAPMHSLTMQEYRMLIGTFASVFPHTSLWLLGSEALLVGSMDSLRIDVNTLKDRMSQVAPMTDLAKISITDPARFLACFIMDETKVKEFVDDVPVISDDRYGLEFSVPHNRVMPISRMWVDNMNELAENRISVLPYLLSCSDSLKMELDKCTRASTHIMNAAVLNAQGQMFQAFTEVENALKIMPDDTTARSIRQETAASVLGMFVSQARLALKNADYQGAENAYLQALSVDSTNTQIQFELVDLYIGLGKFDKVVEYSQKAVMSAPDDPGAHTNLAVVYLNLDRPADAETELLHAIRLDSNFGRAYYFLGQLYQQSGRNDEAQSAFNRVKELGYRE